MTTPASPISDEPDEADNLGVEIMVVARERGIALDDEFVHRTTDLIRAALRRAARAAEGKPSSFAQAMADDMADLATRPPEAQITATEVQAAQEEIGQRAMQSFPPAPVESECVTLFKVALAAPTAAPGSPHWWNTEERFKAALARERAAAEQRGYDKGYAEGHEQQMKMRVQDAMERKP